MNRASLQAAWDQAGLLVDQFLAGGHRGRISFESSDSEHRARVLEFFYQRLSGVTSPPFEGLDD